jgi:hypothetical protein
MFSFFPAPPVEPRTAVRGRRAGRLFFTDNRTPLAFVIDLRERRVLSFLFRAAGPWSLTAAVCVCAGDRRMQWGW